MSAQVTSKAEENSYDVILDWATRREAVVKCRVSDIYRLRASRSSRGTNDGIFFLNQQPCRTIQVVGWVSAISFDSVHRDALDSDVKVSVTIDDPDGQYNITAHQILSNHPRSEPARPLLAVESSKTRPTYRYVPKNTHANTTSSNTRGNLGGSSIHEDTSGYAIKEAKKPIFPNYRVGDTLSIKGRVNEWKRRDGRMIREINANLSMGGEIVIIDPAEEIAHVRLVDHLRTTVYNRPFVVPAPEPLNLRQPATNCHSTPTKFKPGCASGVEGGSPLKKRRLGAEPSSEVEMNGTMGMSSTATGYGDRLRHPLKLHRKHLTLTTFTRYLSSYLERMTETTWSTAASSSSNRSGGINININTADLESPETLDFAAKYLPELQWPTREMQAIFRKRKEAKERERAATAGVNPILTSVGPLDRPRDRGGNDETPRAHRILRTNLTPRRQPSSGSISMVMPVSGSVTVSDENSNSSGGSTVEVISGACSLDHLMHVDYLRDLADRVLRQEYRRRGERRKAQATTDPSKLTNGREEERAKRKADKEEYRRERKRKLRRLFREGIRLKMMEEGSIVEVALTEEDLKEQRVEREARRSRKKMLEAEGGADSFERGWDASFASTFSISNGSVLGDKTDWTNVSTRSTVGNRSQWPGSASQSQKILLANRMFPRPPGMVVNEDESDDSEGDRRDRISKNDKDVDLEKPDPIGYVSLTSRVIGIAILHILHLDAWDRTRKYILRGDLRNGNGLTVEEIHKRIARLHERWEKVGLDVVDAGVEDLLAGGSIARFGKGWKAVKIRTEEGL
ncbi:hypothetical protein FFLO_03072 [Filobasidium floriforme]|uniref:CST complex subunit Stn1 N-terminal domain-containing protein n=1 Tax=Filobasidium floriforme TaxID=5210 RepID=A0A8K0JMU2_9TREE|nr:hypothetical protein FFLO_03072 [Filobasidium floriforme]